jgi:tetratricopeptide (TPR) repeat protein
MQRLLNRLPYALAYLLAFVLGMKQLREPDVWWQLLSGRWMLEHGAVTRKDAFSFTMAGRPWINVKWLYEIWIALLEKITGPTGVLLLQSLVNVAIVFLLFQTFKHFRKHINEGVPALLSVVAVFVFLFVCEYRMAGRPEMVSYLLCALYLWILLKDPQMQLRSIWWLIPLQCLWANMHEGYPVGMVIIGAAVAASLLAWILKKEKTYLRQAARMAIVFIAAALAILINPNTTQLWKQPFEIHRQVWANKYTTELSSFTEPDYWTIQGKIHIVLLATVCLFWLIKIFSGRKQKNSMLYTPALLSYLLMLPLFAYLSLSANRNIPFAQIILFPSVPVMIMGFVRLIKADTWTLYTATVKRGALIVSLLGILFYVTIVTNSFYKYNGSRNRYGIHVSMLHNPTGVADFIRTHNIKGPAFSDYFVSSYLLWDLYPQFKSYIDLRDLDVFPGSFFDDYFSIYNNPQKFDSLDKIYKFNYVVFSNTQMVPLQQKLYWGHGFNLIYNDPVSSLYLRQNETNNAINRNPDLQKFISWPAEIDDAPWAILLTKLFNPAVSYKEEDEENMPLRAGYYYNVMQNFPVAIKMLLPALPQFEDNADAYSVIGDSYMQYASVMDDKKRHQRMTDSARNFFEHAIALDKHQPTAFMGLAGMYMSSGNFREAKAKLDEYIAVDKHHDYVYFMSGVCSRNLWKTEKDHDELEAVIPMMKRALRLNPLNGKTLLYLSEAYLDKDEKGRAKDYLLKAIRSGNPWLHEEQVILDHLKQELGVK